MELPDDPPDLDHPILNPADPADPQTPLFPAVPAHIDGWRPYQWSAVQQAVEVFRRGDVALIEASTGAGKTWIAEATRRVLVSLGIITNTPASPTRPLSSSSTSPSSPPTSAARAAYICTTRHLQDQFVTDYPYAQVLKGRANYLTQLGNVDKMGRPWNNDYSMITCADCTGIGEGNSCRWCIGGVSSCPYQVAARDARTAPLAVLNSAYWLAVGPGDWDRDLVVHDEADTLESELMRQVSLEIGPGDQLKYGIDPPERLSQDAASSDWEPWAETAYDRLVDYQARLGTPSDDWSVFQFRDHKHVENLLKRVGYLKSGLKRGRWAFDGDQDGDIIFRPVYVSDYGQSLLWGRGHKTLLMSATILSPDVFMTELGHSSGYGKISVPSTIPASARPVIFKPAVNMRAQTANSDYPVMAEHVADICRAYPHDRILVHTVSYQLATYLHANVGHALRDRESRPLLVYTYRGEKDEKVEEYKDTPGAVLFASSLDRGIDLPGDLCRVQIVAKVPWMRLSRQVRARMSGPGGEDWYRQHALRTMIQSLGRAVRGPDDYAITYILDAQARRLFGRGLPKYIKEALKERDPKQPEHPDTVFRHVTLP